MKKLKFHIETFGCQMNKSDSELMDLSMNNSGFSPAADEGDADIVIFNTCSVRNHAEERALSRIRRARSSLPESIIVVAGCMAQRLGTDLLKDDTVQMVVGPYNTPAIGRHLDMYINGRKHREYLSQEPSDFHTRIDHDLVQHPDVKPWHKWVTITHGCTNFCSYCIVPYVRGTLISFPSEQILGYCKLLADQGITEISLLGQNVNQYGQDSKDIPFYRLLEGVAAIGGLERVNFLTSHPMDFSDDIIKVIRDNPVISRSLHLPLQSGSDRILAKMNRHYTMAHYMKIVETAERELDYHSMSTDLIVGYPGETGEDYRKTLDAVKTIRYDDAFTYAYSPREGTAAYSEVETITNEEKMKRLGGLIQVQRAISAEKLRSRINSREDLIVEKISKKSPNEVMGKTFLNHPVVMPGSSDDIGKKLRVTITGIKGSTLYGKRIA
ncbi:MAG TPA: tRNA (N6-isopentenyl adenosine(37)-C2)-methylthiotransferase MiaB [Spirochaetota bacterium]|nr:tRNA (N6-isopentenyl adenosine(37)-C2)-methylthiotransferase MiaB [Spirochaetota bacterium]